MFCDRLLVRQQQLLAGTVSVDSMQAQSALNSVSRQVKCSQGLSSSSLSLVCSTAARHPRKRACVKAQVAASWIAGQAVGVGVAAAAAWWLSRQPEEAQVCGSVCADDWGVRVLVIHIIAYAGDA